MSNFSFRWHRSSALIRFIGIANLSLGVMAGFSALLSVLIVMLNANPDPGRFLFFAFLLAATAASGCVSGANLVREKPARGVTVLFGLLLTIFVVTDVFHEHAFPLRLVLVLVYGVTICVISLWPESKVNGRK